jgi:plasmid stabilization system protein ParE
VAVISYAPHALADLERLCDFFAVSDPVLADGTIDLILSAAAVLEQHPLIGRPAESGLRELVISRDRVVHPPPTRGRVHRVVVQPREYDWRSVLMRMWNDSV